MGNLELQIKNYPHFKLRRYGVVLTGPHGRQNKPFIPPSAAFLGRVLAETPATLEAMARRWSVEYEAAHKGYEPKLDVSRKYLVTVDEDGVPRGRKRKLQELTPSDLVHNVRERMRRRFGSKNFWDVGGREAFAVLEEDAPHLGNIVLSGRVKSKGHGGEGGTPRFYSVIIAGALVGAAVPYGKILDNCDDFQFTFGKQGYVGFELLDTHASALLYFASTHPEEFRNFAKIRAARQGDVSFWLPFHADAAQRNAYRTRFTKSDPQPDLSHLTFEVLLDVLFNNRPLAAIDKDLADLPVIFDPLLIQYLQRGDAAFEAVVQEYAYEVGNPLPGVVRNQFNAMRDILHRRGFGMAGYALEGKGTSEELVTLEFRKHTPRGWEAVRWVADGEPSVYIKRVSEPYRKPDLFAESRAKPQSPFADLFKPRRQRDDRTRTATFYEVRLPLERPIPEDLRPDYRALIESRFVGPRGIRGLRGLEAQVNFRNKLVVREGMPAVPLDETQMNNLYRLTRL